MNRLEIILTYNFFFFLQHLRKAAESAQILEYQTVSEGDFNESSHSNLNETLEGECSSNQNITDTDAITIQIMDPLQQNPLEAHNSQEETALNRNEVSFWVISLLLPLSLFNRCFLHHTIQIFLAFTV